MPTEIIAANQGFVSPNRINGVLHILNTNNPPAPSTTYNIEWGTTRLTNCTIQPHQSVPYDPNDHRVTILNHGPSTLQVSYP